MKTALVKLLASSRIEWDTGTLKGFSVWFREHLSLRSSLTRAELRARRQMAPWSVIRTRIPCRDLAALGWPWRNNVVVLAHQPKCLCAVPAGSYVLA